MPRDLPKHEPEKRTEQSFKEVELRMAERSLSNPQKPKPLGPGLTGRTEIVGGTRNYVHQELGARATDPYLGRSRGIELIKRSHDAAGDLGGYFNDWKATLSYKLTKLNRDREPLEINHINFDESFEQLLDHLERADRDSGFVEWLTQWNDILHQANPDPEAIRRIVTSIKEGMNYQEGIVNDFLDRMYERFKADIKAHPPVTISTYDFGDEAVLEKYARANVEEMWKEVRDDVAFEEILGLPHVFQALAFEIFTQSARVYELEPNTKQPTRAGAVVKLMEKSSIRLSKRAEARDLVENGKAGEYYRDRYSYVGGRLDYFKLAEEGLGTWERSVADMSKLIGYYNNGVDAIDTSAWFDTAKSINDSLRGDLSDAVDSLLNESVGGHGKFRDLLTKEEEISYFRDVVVSMIEKHDRYTQGIPATEVDAREIVVSARDKLVGLIERIDKRNVTADGAVTGYTIYDLASTAEAEGRLQVFWLAKKQDLLSSLKARADQASDPTVKKQLVTLWGSLSGLFTPEFAAKLDEWQQKYTALNRDVIDTTWYLYKEINCYKLSVEKIVGELGPAASSIGVTATSYGKFTMLLLDSIMTSIANASERDV